MQRILVHMSVRVKRLVDNRSSYSRRLICELLNVNYLFGTRVLTSSYSFHQKSAHNLKISFEVFRKVANLSKRYICDVNKENEESLNSNLRQLQRHLRCTLDEVEKLLKDNKVCNERIPIVINAFKLCKDNGIPGKIILNNFWVVSIPESELIVKFSLLRKLSFNDAASGIHLIKFDSKKLHSLITFLVRETAKEPELRNSNRITYISSILQADEIVITELVYKCQFLLTMNFFKLKDSLQTILSYGMKPNYLCKDIWVVRFNLDVVKQRLNILRTVMESSELRPWMLHCSEATFKRTVELRGENRTALEPFTSASEYLSNRLEVNDFVIKILKQKHPPLCRVQVHKLKDILDFLFAEGFTATQICSAPRVLCHSLFTLKERLRILQIIGYRPNSLMTLCKTKKQFSDFISKLEHPERYKESSD